ncbi:MAG: glycosyltransferase [Saprospiraceae bacterium]|nr:glycosyltransferase [Saprospiraceae bacterium]
MIFLISIFTLINLSYWIFIFSRFSYHRIDETKEANQIDLNNTVILISAKNEAQNLKRNLSSFIDQKPLGFELLIVDDHSTDGTYTFLEESGKSISYLKTLRSENDEGKKQALNFGIEKTDREFIAMTDADCYAVSDKWLNLMVSGFNSNNTDIVLGYSPYVGNGLLTSFIRFETFMTALQYFSYALAGIPYMGVGRNMAFRKSFFLKNNRFDNHLDIKSGSDDLFINETSKPKNIFIQYDPDSFIYTYPDERVFDFFRQKSRHISTSFRYKLIHKFLLGLYSFSHIGFYLLIIYSVFIGNINIVLLFLVIRYTTLYIASFGAFSKLKEKDLLIWLPVLDFLMFIYYISLSFFYYFYPKNRWK